MSAKNMITDELSRQIVQAVENMFKIHVIAWPIIVRDEALLVSWTEVLANLQALHTRLIVHAQEGITIGQDAIACADRGRAFMDALAEKVQKRGSPRDGTAGGT